MHTFELPEIAALLNMNPAKAKNWTNGRTGLVIEPSIRKASGTGSRNIYSLQDVYLMAVAQQFSTAGFAAKAIGKLMEAVKPKLQGTIKKDEVWTLWRVTPGGPFHVAGGRSKPDGRHLWHTFEVGALVRAIDERIGQMRR
jgi:hypothetical protein